MEARSEMAEAYKRAAMELAANEARLQQLRAKRAASADAYAQQQATMTELEGRRQDLQNELSAVPYDAARHAALVTERRALVIAVNSQECTVDTLAALVQRCNFHYDPPEPNFDASRVLGTVARLIRVSDPMYYTAVEELAGDKLFNVVVDTQETGYLLLEHGNLRETTTFIPLDHIYGPVIHARTVAAAQEIGGGAEAVQLALDLVSGPEAVGPMLRWLFGSTLVCRDRETAHQLCFDSRVQCRCITLDGDEYDPEGLITGGARTYNPSLLQQLAALSAAETLLQEYKLRLQTADDEQAALQRAKEPYYALKQRLDTVSSELESLTARMANSEHVQTQAEIESVKAQVSEIKRAMQRYSAALEERAARGAKPDAGAAAEQLEG